MCIQANNQSIQLRFNFPYPHLRSSQDVIACPSPRFADMQRRQTRRNGVASLKNSKRMWHKGKSSDFRLAGRLKDSEHAAAKQAAERQEMSAERGKQDKQIILGGKPGWTSGHANYLAR